MNFMHPNYGLTTITQSKILWGSRELNVIHVTCVHAVYMYMMYMYAQLS